MVSGEVRQEVLRRLSAIEQADDVRIVFAAESGSRAWGFPSPDSDFDVRFIYVRPTTEYLRPSPRRDVIELPIDGLWDINGWDLRKALLLLRKGNAVVVEWLRSPITYREVGPTAQALRVLASHFGDPASAIRHYHGLLHGQWRREFAGRDQVRLKKYFYAVRAALALSWVRLTKTIPPMSLPDLLAADIAPAALRAEIDRLLVLKDRTSEVGAGPRVAVLDAFIEAQLDWARETDALRAPRLNPAFAAATDQAFLDALKA